MLLFWNIRSLNDPRKQRKLIQALKNFHVSIICLLETHVQQNNFSAISERILPGWNVIANYEFAPLGRIWLFSNAEINMEVFSKSSQAIHCHIFSKSLKKYFFLSVVYGANTVAERKDL